MEVTFRKTGSRRYAVDVRREGFPDVTMDPAPGFDRYLPHDMVHFLVEVEVGLTFGVFGQLAKGGDAGTFRKYQNPPGDSRTAGRQRRRAGKRGARLSEAGHRDAVFSERAAVICEHAWLMRSTDADRRSRGREMAPYVKRMWEECSPSEASRLTSDAIDSVCARFDELSREWTKLEINEGITLRWPT